MGLTVDFSMGFVCFDAASKVGVRRSSIVNKRWCLPRFLQPVHFGSVPFKLFRRFWPLPKSERRDCDSARYWNERDASAAILFRDFGPVFLKHLRFSRMRHTLPDYCLQKETL